MLGNEYEISHDKNAARELCIKIYTIQFELKKILYTIFV